MTRLLSLLVLVSFLSISTSAEAARISYPDFVRISSDGGAVTTTGIDCGAGLCDDQVALSYTSSEPISSNLDWMSPGQRLRKLVFSLRGPGRFRYSSSGIVLPESSIERDTRLARIEFDVLSPYTVGSPVNSRDLYLSYRSEFFGVGEFDLIGVRAIPSVFYTIPLPAPVALLGSGLFLLGLLRARSGPRSATASA